MGNWNKNPSPATRFKKGQCPNPGGRPKQALSADQIKGLLTRMLAKTKSQLSDVLSDPKSTMLEMIIASVIAKAVKDGDYNRLNFLFDRSFGKVKDEIEQTIRAMALPTPQEARKILEGDLE